MKKMLSTLLALLLAAASLAGCAGTPAPTVQPTAEAATATAAPQESADATAPADDRKMEGNMYVTGLPIVKEPETFTMMVDDGGKPEDKVYYEILEKQTNVKVDLLLYPYETAVEKMKIALNSGDYPDVIGGWLLGDNDVLTMGMRDQLFIPIDEFINKYSPKMQEILNIEGVKPTMTLPDGHIYSVPYVIGTPQVDFLPFINSAWLKTVGKAMPKTTEEFADVLRAFKSGDPNGNGQKDEIPFSADPNNKNLGYMAGWFGTTVGRDGFAMVGDKLTFTADSDSYKNYIAYMADLYKEGLIDPELFTQDLAQWKAKGNQNLYGCSVAYGSGDFVTLNPGERTPYDALPVLKGTGVDNPVFMGASYGSTIFRTQVCITDKAKNPATIIRWWDNVFQEENSMQIQNGLFGKRLEKLADGSYRALDEAKLSEDDRQKYGWGNMFTQSLPKYCPLNIVVQPAEGTPPSFDEKKTADEAYKPFLTKVVPQAWVAEADAKRLSVLTTDIKTYIEKKQAEWITGQADVNAEWDAYKAQLKTLGLDELVSLRTKAVGQ